MSPAKGSDLHFDYYERSSRPEIRTVAGFLERLFDEYPNGHHKATLRTHMCSSNEGFTSAFFELFLHSLFIRLSAQVVVQPEIPGVGSRPDFHVTLATGAQFYVEAVVVSGDSHEEQRKDRLLATFYDYINENLQTPRFLWQVQILQRGTSQPSGSNICSELKKYEQTLEWEQVDQAWKSSIYQPFHPNGVTVTSRSWQFRFTPIPRRREDWDTPERAIAVYPVEGGICLPAQQIRAAVSKKRRQHPDLDKPLVIAVNATAMVAKEIDIERALYGSEAVECGIDQDGEPRPPRLVRNPDGFWFGPAGKQNDHVPFIIGFRRLCPHTIAKSTACVYTNPYIDLDPDILLPRLPRLVNSGGLPSLCAGDGLGAIFDLPDGWPE